MRKVASAAIDLLFSPCSLRAMSETISETVEYDPTACGSIAFGTAGLQRVRLSVGRRGVGAAQPQPAARALPRAHLSLPATSALFTRRDIHLSSSSTAAGADTAGQRRTRSLAGQVTPAPSNSDVCIQNRARHVANHWHSITAATDPGLPSVRGAPWLCSRVEVRLSPLPPQLRREKLLILIGTSTRQRHSGAPLLQ